MSVHPSLKVKSNLLRSRNVWKRIERLEKLKQEGEWEEGKPVHGLRKVRTVFKTKAKT
jgi:small basic protein (TIGR04137 family)